MYLITVHIHEYTLILPTNPKSSDYIPRPQTFFSDVGVQGFSRKGLCFLEVVLPPELGLSDELVFT